MQPIGTELILAFFAVLMVRTAAFLVKWGTDATTPVEAGLVVFPLVMMAAIA